MPLVTAANYPTQTEPKVAPLPTPGDDTQKISGVSPDAFGAGVGRAVSGIGADFAKGANEFEQVAIAQQRLINQVASDNSVNYVMKQGDNVLHGDPNVPGDGGFYGLKGNDAVQARQSTVANLDKVIQSARSQLTNQRQLLMFDSETRQLRTRWMQQIGIHYDTQLNVHADNVATAQGQIAAQSAASAAANGDMGSFSLAVETGMKAAIQGVRNRGGTQDEVDAALGNVRADATKMWATSLGTKDPQAALRFLEANRDALKPGEYPQIYNELSAKADQATADAAVNRALGRSSSGAAAAQSGNVGQRVAKTLQARGWSDAAITGALNSGITESGLQEWNNPGAGGEQGIFQFHPDSHLPKFTQAYGGNTSAEAQANYVADVVDKTMPGYATIGDSRAATSRFVKEFEAPKDQSASAIAARGGNTPRSQAILAGLGGAGGSQPPATPAPQPQGIQIAGQSGTYRLTPDQVKAYYDLDPGQKREDYLKSLPQPATAVTPGAPLSRGQEQLANMPDYFRARDAIVNDPTLTDRQKRLATDRLSAQIHQDLTLQDAQDANAKKALSDRQTAAFSDLFGRVLKGETIDPQTLAPMVRSQQLTPEQSRAVIAEQTRQGRGTDDQAVYADLDRRARAGEDVSNDIATAVGNGQLRGTTGLSLQRAADARTQRRTDQVERNNFSALRTIAGMDAAEHPLVDLGKEANQAQVQLWAQAQQEWNQRVLIRGEDSTEVLADMSSRYSHPIDDTRALPHPRLGAITTLDDVSTIAQKTQAAFDAGQLSEAQFRDEQTLIKQYRDILVAAQARKDAADAAKAKKK